MMVAPFSFKRLPQGVKWLLIANGIVFVLQMMFTGLLENTFGLVPHKVWSQLHLWRPLTYLFLHGSFFHLLFNMFALWMFGKELEYAWGRMEFLKFFFICGVGAGLFNTLFEPLSTIPIIGASGAVYGILVAFAVVFPDSVIYLYGLFPMRSKHFVLLIGALEFFASFHGASTLIARFAHLGGMATGYFYLKSYELRSVLNRFLYRLMDLFVEKKPKFRVERPSEPTGEDLVKEVDRILQKVLVKGADSLTEKERGIMRRYSSRKH